MEILRHVKNAIIFLLILIVVGIVGYCLIEGWSILDSIYMVFISITTVGFTEVHPLSTAGRIFTIFFIIIGLISIFYLIGSIIEFIIEGHLAGWLERRRMEKRLFSLKDHYIICGYGRVGRQVVLEFIRTNQSFVVVDTDAKFEKEWQEKNIPYVIGDASEDEVLEMAGVKRAKALLAATGSDAENVFITLSVKMIRPDLFVIARANSEESEVKLERAGAQRVISPSSLAGRRMASLLLQPTVCDYLDIVTKRENLEYRLEEFKIGKDSSVNNLTVEEADNKYKLGAVILAIQKKSGELRTFSTAETKIEDGDRIIALGTEGQLEKLDSLLK